MDFPPKARDKLDMKLYNRAMVWDLILNARPVSRAQLAKTTSMSPTSITRIVSELIAFGLLVESPSTDTNVGRKAVLLDIDPDAVFTVGVEIDVHSITTCLLDLDNQVRIIREQKHEIDYPPPEKAVQTALAMYKDMLAMSGIASEKVKAAGVAIGGTVDHINGRIKVSPQLHWQNVRLQQLIEEAFEVPTVVENDVKAAIIEEYVRHRECRTPNIAYLTIGSGVGAAVMHHGRLLTGHNNAAGEVGHITVQPNGELCDCGRYGCLYTRLSEKNLRKRIGRLSGGTDDYASWTEAQSAGEAWAIGLANEISGYIAMALNQLLCSYDPETIIVGGRLIHANPGLLTAALDKQGLIYEALRSDAHIIPSKQPDQDALAGAAILARNVFLKKLLHETL
jgi:Transcriptional regulator/sugar kinase